MHDPTRAGYTPAQLALPLAERWTYSSPAPPQRAWPGESGEIVEGLKLEHRVRFDDVFHTVVVGESAYFGSSVDNTVYCLHADTGEVRWSFVTSGPVRLAPTIAYGRAYVGSDDGRVYCLDANTGELIWQLLAGPRDERILRGRMTSRWPIRTGVLVDDAVAYFGAGVFPHDNVYLCAVRADNGQVIWKNDTVSEQSAGRDDLSPQGYLLASDDILFVPSGRTLPAALDRRTGRYLHKQLGGGKQVGGDKALLADDQIYSIGGEEFILALDQRTGGISNRLRGRQMTLHGPVAYIADGDQITAIDRVRYAASHEQRLALEAQLFDLQRRMRANPAVVQLQRVRQLQQQVAAAQQAAEDRRAVQDDQTPAQQAAEAAVVQQSKVLASAAAVYETSRQEYRMLEAQLRQLQQQVDEATRDGVKWRRPLAHHSALVRAGDALVVGGIGEVVLLDAETGQPVWSHEIDGEVRGLTVANQLLLVSSTAGKIYCFGGSAAPAPDPTRDPSHPAAEPFPQDELSSAYAAAADQIIQQTGVKRGFCLVYGNQQGRLAYQLARKTDLVIYCLETDEENVAQARRALAATGLYGTRITVDCTESTTDPYADYFANLIVSDTLLATGQMPGEPAEVARHLKPAGGIFCLGGLDGFGGQSADRAAEQVASWLPRIGLADEEIQVENRKGWTVVTRGPLPGAADWTHQYGNPGNTASVDDQRVRGGVRVLWYGDPGPSGMVNRHLGAVGPVSVAGRLFMQGDKNLMAYDAYNGQFLWQRDNPGAVRTGVYNNYEPGNLVATEDSVLMVVEDRCLQLDAATGEVHRTYTLPVGAGERQWGYLGYVGGRLYGTSTSRKLLAEEARRRGRPHEADESDSIFAIDIASGQPLWTYHGQNVSHTTLALDDQRVYFVDSSITPQQRDRMLQQDKSQLQKLTGKDRQLAEDRLKRIDLRRAVALDARTGQPVWSELVDVTDCTGVGIGAGRLTLMVSGGYVVLCGANANGHYWEQFLAGDFQRRRLVVLSARMANGSGREMPTTGTGPSWFKTGSSPNLGRTTCRPANRRSASIR